MDCNSAIDATYFTKAKYPKFMKKQARLSTYTSWMASQRIEDMADAVFISLHQQDRVLLLWRHFPRLATWTRSMDSTRRPYAHMSARLKYQGI